MTSRLVVVVGAGGFGREALDVIDAINNASGSSKFDVLGVLDDAPSERNVSRLTARGVAHLGPIDDWLASGEDAEYLIAVGSPRVRRALATKFEMTRSRPATAVHPNAGIGSVGSIGAGSIICAGVQVSTNVHIGQHVHVNPSATIGHDSTLADYVSVNPAATISGECTIEKEVLVGSAAVILPGLRVGAGSTVGAAACVVRDVMSDVIVKGVPAR